MPILLTTSFRRLFHTTQLHWGTTKVYSATRWFKYDRAKLWLVYTQIVPVIFEPPCILLMCSLWAVLWWQNSHNMHWSILKLLIMLGQATPCYSVPVLLIVVYPTKHLHCLVGVLSAWLELPTWAMGKINIPGLNNFKTTTSFFRYNTLHINKMSNIYTK
jgi:hypothetical protein